MIPKVVSFADLARDIHEDIDDAHHYYVQEVEKVIRNALCFFQNASFYFSSQLGANFTVKMGQKTSHKEQIDSLKPIYYYNQLARQTGQNYCDLTPIASHLWPDICQKKERGAPQYYCLFEVPAGARNLKPELERIEIYPIPDKEYRMKLYVFFHRNEPLSFYEPSPWLCEGYGLLKARAQYDLYKNILQDEAMAISAYQDYQEQYALLLAETSKRKARGLIQATQF